MEHASASVASGSAGVDAGARPAAGGDGGARVRTTSRVACSEFKRVASALFERTVLQKFE
jgi:hypothetical protein